ncbi:hypothetical protein QTN47_02155 [Danxiaibacter flavus]|uniref:Secreted protein n=1 Tax=Danxiaibacter flavus TaxID=3049108 RepID=A0ABV3Z8T3_9BACT|nr:hypothetical protein QNM32_02155 [Chitinophagaceae bacterium DXS]
MQRFLFFLSATYSTGHEDFFVFVSRSGRDEAAAQRFLFFLSATYSTGHEDFFVFVSRSERYGAAAQRCFIFPRCGR